MSAVAARRSTHENRQQRIVTEAVVCAWKDTYRLRCRLELRAASVGSTLDVTS